MNAATPSRRSLLVGLGALGVGMAGAGAFALAASARSVPPRIALNDAALGTGDWLFRRTVSLEGLEVQALDAAAGFSHVGLVVGHDETGCAQVVHACPPERVGESGVRLTTAWLFISGSDVHAAAAYRPTRMTSAQCQRMARWSLQRLGWDFNAGFALGAPHALYCTELIYRAMQSAGAQPLPRLQRWFTPLGRREVVTLSALLDMPGLRLLPQACRARPDRA